MKAFLISAFAAGLALSTTAAMAQSTDTTTPPPPPGGEMGMMKGPITKAQHRQHAEQMFKELDTDGNGTITRQEFDAATDAKFDRMDTNKDGTLSADEHRAAMQQHMKHKPRGGQQQR